MSVPQKVTVTYGPMAYGSSSHAGLFDFDPYVKLKEADYMVGIDRPIAADKLISDVLVFCKKKNDDACLATAFFYYGKLLMWRVPDEYDRQKNGIRRISSYIDKDVTVGNVNQKAMEYFDKALILAKTYELHDIASAIYVKEGILQATYFKDQAAACNSFDKSLENHLLARKNNRGVRAELPKGFNSFEEYIFQGKKEAGCL